MAPALEMALKKQADLVKDMDAKEDDVLVAVDEVWGLRTKMARAQTKKLLFVKSKLTPEQLEAARKMAEEAQSRPTPTQNLQNQRPMTPPTGVAPSAQQRRNTTNATERATRPAPQPRTPRNAPAEQPAE